MSRRRIDVAGSPAFLAEKRTRRGFTLVELLVVIGIIALLMSILLPTLGRVKEQANSIKCRSNLRTLTQAFIMYAKDNKDFFPAGSRYPSNLVRTWDWIWYQEKPLPPERPVADLSQSAIVPYLSGSTFTKALFLCPSDTEAENRALNGSNTEPYKYSYAMNQEFESRPGWIVKTSMIRNQTMKILLAEEDENSINDGLWAPGDGSLTSTAARDLLAIRHDRQKVYPDPRDQVLNTHPNGMRAGNVSFIDGHVEYLTRKEAHVAERIFRNR